MTSTGPGCCMQRFLRIVHQFAHGGICLRSRRIGTLQTILWHFERGCIALSQLILRDNKSVEACPAWLQDSAMQKK